MDLAGRIQQLIETTAGFGVIALAVFIIAGLVMAALGQRRALLTLYIMAFPFSGFPIAAIDSASTLFRWFLMLMLALTCLRGMAFPGWGTVAFAASALLAALMGLYGPIPWYSTQRAGLLLVMTLPFAAAIAHYLSTKEDFFRLLRVFVIAGAMMVVLGVLGFRDAEEGQYQAGILGRAGMMSFTGGLLMPWLLWGGANEYMKRNWRWICLLLFCSLAGVVAITGRRGGIVAGLIACVPIVAKFGLRRLRLVLVAVLLFAVTLVVVAAVFPVQFDYVIERFTEGSLSGRELIWAIAWNASMENPWVGRGMNTEYQVVSNGFHNVWLKVLYEVGIFGLLAFALVFAYGTVQAIRYMLAGQSAVVRDMARLTLGLLMGAGVMSMFESSVFGPGSGNISSFTLIIAVVLAHRLKHMAQNERTIQADLYLDEGYLASYGVQGEYAHL